MKGFRTRIPKPSVFLALYLDLLIFTPKVSIANKYFLHLEFRKLFTDAREKIMLRSVNLGFKMNRPRLGS